VKKLDSNKLQTIRREFIDLRLLLNSHPLIKIILGKLLLLAFETVQRLL
jgi:hypothetical protein